ncbi:MAG: hypothetical protein ACK5AU_02220 [Flavobacteriales bacterium]|jgi:hypothetical protein
MGFLDNYEASRERLERWNRTFPLGRIETRIVEFSAEKGYVLVEAKAFRNQDDVLPAGVDYAYGYQGAYQQNMKRWFCEDTVTSAIMRVQQLVMGGAERSTKEIMEQVERTPAKIANTDTTDYWTTKFGDVPSYKTAGEAEQSGVPSFGSSLNEIAQQLGAEIMPEAPKCDHGHRIWRESKEGAAKKWGGYFCPEREKNNQCQPFWYVVSSTGKWAAQL